MLVRLRCWILRRRKAKVLPISAPSFRGRSTRMKSSSLAPSMTRTRPLRVRMTMGSAVAALLELARHFVRQQTARTLRFVAFTNEESPFTRRKAMGSRVYAGECRRRRDNIIGMICLETIGCYSEEIGSQWLSFGGLFLPRRGDFLALVANAAL